MLEYGRRLHVPGSTNPIILIDRWDGETGAQQKNTVFFFINCSLVYSLPASVLYFVYTVHYLYEVFQYFVTTVRSFK